MHKWKGEITIDNNQIVKEVSQHIYDIFVVNSSVIGFQMPDGNYIPKIVNYDSSIFSKMIEKKMSLGIYQQKYKRNVVKWICLDFDCKDIVDGNLHNLIASLVNPCIELLEKNKISYLLEFSGRRGIHVWIVFDTIISKSQAYKIVSNIKSRLLMNNSNLLDYEIDIFPKTSGGINKYGSMVKCPLSWHKRGKQSFLMTKTSEFITATGLDFNVDLEKQLDILKAYKKNDYYNVCEKLNVTIVDSEITVPIYKKQYLLLNKSNVLYSFNDIEEKCSSSKMLKKIFKNVKEGCLSHIDRLILVSTLSSFNDELLYSLFELQKNYNYQKTREYVNKYKMLYYPITMQYLYDIYCENLEDSISPEITVLEYICEKLNIEKKLIKDLVPSANSCFVMPKLINLIEKEMSYMKYNDEVLEIVDYYKMQNINNYDLKKIEKICQDAIEEGKKIAPGKFRIYNRFEEANKEPRKLISLSVQDRIISSYLIFELASLINWRYDSYSYNINFMTSGDIFISWYHSWNNFNNAINNYVNTEIFEDLNVIKLDLKKFYDNIYFHSIYNEIIGDLSQSSLSKNNDNLDKIKNIFHVLCSYNEQIMLQIGGEIKGVPQGPAYARIMAEIFIASIIKKFKKENSGLIILRYVDDMFILHDSSKNSKDLIKKINSLLLSKGLKLNDEKTKIYGEISKLDSNEKAEICSMNCNYSIRTIKSLELESFENREQKIDFFKRFIDSNDDWKKDANFILNDYIEEEFINLYLKKYFKDVVSSNIGRGSIFKKLYQYIMNEKIWLEIFLKEKLYTQIPSKSINMKTFLNELFDQILNNNVYEYSSFIDLLIDFLLNKDDLDISEENVICVIYKKWMERAYENK